ncbi:MAG TPA: hypothetical protein VFP70_01845 [Burkholderiales bacterium]|nr:hypothetical protein [Burkholderiales bacterium]
MRAMQPRRWFRLVLLLVALLAVQQAALVHPYSHHRDGAATQEDPHALAGEACDQCVAYAVFAGALPAGGGALPSLDAGAGLPGADPAPPRGAEIRLSRARDPPFFL